MYTRVCRTVCNYCLTKASTHEKNDQNLLPTIVAVSKTRTSAEIYKAWCDGARHFGENYVQEAIEKIAKGPKNCQWHMIGQVQSNKTVLVAQHFAWVQTISRYKIAQRLSVQRPRDMPALQICIQVNIDDDPNKSGCTPQQVIPLACEVSTLANISLRGLMVVPNQYNPPPSAFAKTAALFTQMKHHLPRCQIDTLSMGMSGDWKEAIDAGSTMIRIGTNIFGQRKYTV